MYMHEHQNLWQTRLIVNALRICMYVRTCSVLKKCIFHGPCRWCTWGRRCPRRLDSSRSPVRRRPTSCQPTSGLTSLRDTSQTYSSGEGFCVKVNKNFSLTYFFGMRNALEPKYWRLQFIQFHKNSRKLGNVLLWWYIWWDKGVFMQRFTVVYVG